MLQGVLQLDVTIEVISAGRAGGAVGGDGLSRPYLKIVKAGAAHRAAEPGDSCLAYLASIRQSLAHNIGQLGLVLEDIVGHPDLGTGQ